MQLTITLPDSVHALLAAHPKGAETAVLIAIKRHLRATATEGRDQAIADDAVRGATHAELANKYALSIPRIQQLVALGREAALLRNPPKPTHTTTTNPRPHTTDPRTAELLKEWAYEPEPIRTTTTTTPQAPIHNPAHDFDLDIDF